MTAVSKPIAAALLDQAESVRLLGRLPAADAPEYLVGNLLVDVLVHPVEDREHVGPADDADQAPDRVGDREPLDPCGRT
jgi:hypothetical protein